MLTEIDEGGSDAESGDRDPTHEFETLETLAGTLETLGDTTTLQQLVRLRAALEDRDAVIASLGERLAATREAVRRRDATERSLRRHLTEADRLRAGLEQRVAELERTGTGGSPATPATPASGAGQNGGKASRKANRRTGRKAGGQADAEAAAMTAAERRSLEAELRESRDAYAALAAYVDGRRRFWEAQNARIEDLEVKVRELDAELKQRIRRERDAVDAAHREARRAGQLESLLAAVRRDLRDAHSAGQEPPSSDLRLPVTPSLRPPAPGAGWQQPVRPLSSASRPTDTPGGERTDTPGGEPADTPGGEPTDTPGGEPAERSPARRRVMLCLADTPPSEYPIDGRTMVIGRGPECDITVATHFMSRQHARLGITAGRVTIEDLGSRNGVLVNSIRVERAILQNGDFITLGETLFRYIEDHAPTA